MARRSFRPDTVTPGRCAQCPSSPEVAIPVLGSRIHPAHDWFWVGSRHLLQVPPVLELTSVYLALVIGEGGLLAPRTPQEALEIFRNPDANDWERDYAALMIDSLDEALPELEKVARDASASEMLQQRAAEVLGCAWRDRGILLTADITGFTPIARQEILFHRGEGLPYPD